MDDNATRFVVALPGGLALVVFLWWLYRELRKSRAAKRASTHVPDHIIVVQDKRDPADHSGRNTDATYSALEDQQVTLVDDDLNSAPSGSAADAARR